MDSIRDVSADILFAILVGVGALAAVFVGATLKFLESRRYYKALFRVAIADTQDEMHRKQFWQAVGLGALGSASTIALSGFELEVDAVLGGFIAFALYYFGALVVRVVRLPRQAVDQLEAALQTELESNLQLTREIGQLRQLKSEAAVLGKLLSHFGVVWERANTFDAQTSFADQVNLSREYQAIYDATWQLIEETEEPEELNLFLDTSDVPPAPPLRNYCSDLVDYIAFRAHQRSYRLRELIKKVQARKGV